MTFDSADFPWTFNDQEEQMLPGQAGANKDMEWEAQTAISPLDSNTKVAGFAKEATIEIKITV